MNQPNLFPLPPSQPVDKIERPTRVKGDITGLLVECPVCKTLKTKGLPCRFCHEQEGRSRDQAGMAGGGSL